MASGEIIVSKCELCVYIGGGQKLLFIVRDVIEKAYIMSRPTTGTVCQPSDTG